MRSKNHVAVASDILMILSLSIIFSAFSTAACVTN